MSSTQAQDDGTACILCFWAKRKCIIRGKPCCSGASSDQLSIDASPCIGLDAFEPSIIQKLRGWSHTQQTRLPCGMNSGYILECEPTSDLGIGTPYTFTIEGAIDVSNNDLVAQLDRMVLDTFAPKIQATDGAPKSISLACLAIGYSNKLIFGKLQDNSESHNKHDLSPVLAELAIMRINDIIANLMNSVRHAQLELDTETRPGLVLWYLYLSIIRAKLPKMGRCQIFDDLELYQHVQKTLSSFREELRKRLAADCKNKARWAAAFASQRDVVKKIRDTVRFWTLSIKLVPLSDGGIGDCSPHLHPDSYNTPYSNGVGPRPRSKVGLFAMGQPSTKAANGSPAFSATSDKDSKWNEKMVGSHGPGCDSCETAKSGGAGIHEDVANDMFECNSLFQGSTHRALTASRSNNGEIEWDNNFATFSNACGGHNPATGVAFSNEPQMPPLNPSHYKLLQNHVASNQPQAHQVNNYWDEDSSDPSLDSALTDFGANLLPLATCGSAYNTQPTSYTSTIYNSTNETAGRNLDQNIDMFSNLFGFDPCHLQRDDFGPF